MPTRGCGSRPRRFATTPPSRSDAPPTPGVPSNAGPSTCSSSALVDDDVAHGCRRPGGAPMAFCSSAVGCSSRMSRWLSVQRASALTAVAAHDDRRTVLHVVDVAVELRLQFLGGDRSSCCGGRRRAGRPPRARRFGDVPPLEVGRGEAAANRRFAWSTPRPTTASPGSGAVAACRRQMAAAQPPTRRRMSGRFRKAVVQIQASSNRGMMPHGGGAWRC